MKQTNTENASKLAAHLAYYANQTFMVAVKVQGINQSVNT